MAQLFAAFGIDWRLLVINLVNFGLLLVLLRVFLYKPLTGMLESRRLKVIEGVRNAELAAARLEEVESSVSGRMSDAAAQADKMLADARATAVEKERALVAQGEAVAASLLKDAEAQAAELQREAVLKSKEDVAKLIVLGMEKMQPAQK
ncbi:MAG: atpF [Candidatus Adlerbacteria bacterium]|nr:atpF [Candidatus Adlerbacteria bacterium]